MKTTKTTDQTARLEKLSNIAASAIARDQIDRAQAATVSMRMVLEAHPEVPRWADWMEIHDAHAEACGA